MTEKDQKESTEIKQRENRSPTPEKKIKKFVEKQEK